MNMTGADWEVGELALSPSKMFVLWSINVQFCTTLSDFERHLDSPRVLYEAVETLRRFKLIARGGDELIITERGRFALGDLASSEKSRYGVRSATPQEARAFHGQEEMGHRMDWFRKTIDKGKRKHRRTEFVEVEARVTIQDVQRKVLCYGRVKNIGLHGFYFHATTPIQIEREALLMFSVSISREAQKVFPFSRVVGKGRIVRIEHLSDRWEDVVGIAVEFTRDVTAFAALPES